jgi:potassium efflux system protein
MKPELPYEVPTEALRSLTWQRGLIALGAMVGFFLVAKLAGWLVRRSLAKRQAWGGPVFALSKLLTYFLVVVGVVTALGLLGLPLSSLVLTSSALLVGIGFSLQHVVRDFVGGLVLLIEQSIRKGDYVTFGTTKGKVQEIGLRSTHVHTRDGTELIVPNHLLITSEVSNHSHPIERARLDVELPVAFQEDIDLVEETLLSVAGDHPLVMSDPAPTVRLDAITESHFQFTLAVWVKEPAVTLRVGSELRFAIARAFARRGIQFPTPELRLH